MLQNSILNVGGEEEALRRKFSLLPTVQLERIGELWYVAGTGMTVEEYAQNLKKKETEE